MQEEYIGVRSLRSLKQIIEKINAKKILLLTGKKSYSTSDAKTKLEPFLRGLKVTRFSDFIVNHTIEP